MLELIPEQYHELYTIVITLVPTITALIAQIVSFIMILRQIFKTAQDCTDRCTAKCDELMSGNDIIELKALVNKVVEENAKLKEDYLRMTEICSRVAIKREENHVKNNTKK